jgi:aryl-alcohol dehydrogenase-like predicted oxidoreductase
VEAVESLAAEKGCTSAQLALAWLLAQGDDVVPIPGTRSLKRLAENAGAVSVELDSEDLQDLDALLAAMEVHGARYPAAAVSLLSGDTPEPGEAAGAAD